MYHTQSKHGYNMSFVVKNIMLRSVKFIKLITPLDGRSVCCVCAFDLITIRVAKYSTEHSLHLYDPIKPDQPIATDCWHSACFLFDSPYSYIGTSLGVPARRTLAYTLQRWMLDIALFLRSFPE